MKDCRTEGYFYRVGLSNMNEFLIHWENPGAMGVVGVTQVDAVDLNACMSVQTLKDHLNLFPSVEFFVYKEAAGIGPVLTLILVELQEVVSVVWVITKLILKQIHVESRGHLGWVEFRVSLIVEEPFRSWVGQTHLQNIFFLWLC